MLARLPKARSSPKESKEEMAHLRRRLASGGEDGWWVEVRGTAAPSLTRERRMRVSPTWAMAREKVVEGCQKGVGVGVEIKAMEAVEPPRKGLGGGCSEGGVCGLCGLVRW